MIQTEQEYLDAVSSLREERRAESEQERLLEEYGWGPEEIERVLAPIRAISRRREEEVEAYERATGRKRLAP